MTTRQTIKRFFEPVKENPGFRAQASVQYFFFSLGGLISIVFLRLITQSIEGGNVGLFQNYLIRFIISYFLFFIIRLLIRNRGWAKVYTIGSKQVYQRYLRKYIGLDNTHIEKIGIGRMISILQQGYDNWLQLLELVFWKGIDLIMTLGFASFVIWYTDSKLFFLFVVSFIIVQVIGYNLNGYILENKRKTNPIKNEFMRSIVRILMSKFEIMQQNKIDYEIDQLNLNRDQFLKVTKQRTRAIEGVYLTPNILTLGLWIGLFMIVGRGIFDGTYTYADLILFSSTLGLLDRTMDITTTAIKDFFQKFSEVEQLRNTFDNIKKYNYQSGSPFTYNYGSIDLVNISFSYEDTFVFSNFSVQLLGGKKTALVGPSGGGKSTLIKLIAGYLQPDSGSVIVDGQDLKDVSLLSYYKHVGYLTQEPSVFDGSIRENLQYGMDQSVAENKVNKSIENVLPLAKCERIYDLPQGLDTEIGERGVRLSGGQKQRLAIAKIMLKNPDIILLDEPTSALDSANEQAVTEALNNLFKNKTVIIIAHRLQTVKNADDIIYIADGQVVERGTHDQLLALGGEYYKMVELQSGF